MAMEMDGLDIKMAVEMVGLDIEMATEMGGLNTRNGHGNGWAGHKKWPWIGVGWTNEMAMETGGLDISHGNGWAVHKPWKWVHCT